jgi:hypothetical protein
MELMGGEGTHNVFDPTEILEDIANVIEDIADVQVVVDNIQDDVTDILAIADGLPTLTSVVGSTTTTTIDTEYDLYINNAPLGVFRPILVTVNFLNQTAAETVIIRKYRRDTDGGVWTEFDESLPYVGIQDPHGIEIDFGPNRFGVRATIERIAGNARAYPWAAFYEL